MQSTNQTYAGLTAREALARQAEFGKNELHQEKRQSFFRKAIHIILEPMFLLLLAAACIYFLLGEPRDGVIMLVFVTCIISIDILQTWKTDKTLNALKDLSAPRVTVLRDGQETSIASADLVPGDVMRVHEGVRIPADGIVLSCSDLCVDESSLTGEAEGVWKLPEEEAPEKSGHWRRDCCYAGTLVLQGSGMILVEAIGASTEYGKIGTHVAEAPDRPTPLEKQTARLVKLCAGIAVLLLTMVGVFTFFSLADVEGTNRLVQSVLSGITLAMAMIPEEFPVVLTVFLSMGAWRLAKKHTLVRRLPAVETLGAVSVLCVDKTGTITMNQMTVERLRPFSGNESVLCEVMGLACETDAYDPMEKAMLRHAEACGFPKESLFDGTLLKEFPFTNETKRMGHVWLRGDGIILAAKGSPEHLLPLCGLTETQRSEVEGAIREMSDLGLRMIAVASAKLPSEDAIPETLGDAALTLSGLVGLADPPRPTVREDIATCARAGIRVVMITGDNGVTAASIARQIGMPNAESILTGDEIDRMDDTELRAKARNTGIFSRVTPEHKMRIVKAIKENGDIVAMTGDGVNDAPALKYADIGIAMGKRGSEVAREAADLILMDDNFGTIVETVRDGRRIYQNIRKAVGYILTIHLPIALSSLLAPLLRIAPANLLLTPLHVVLLELIIDPTCSIVLERQPAERDIMERGPRNPKEQLLTPSTLLKSVLQGLAIFAFAFGTYYFVMAREGDATVARSMGLSIIVLANLLLVHENSSETDSILRSFARCGKDAFLLAVSLVTVAGLAVMLYTGVGTFLSLAPLSAPRALCVLGLSAASVLWYDIVKWWRRKHGRKAEHDGD